MVQNDRTTTRFVGATQEQPKSNDKSNDNDKSKDKDEDEDQSNDKSNDKSKCMTCSMADVVTWYRMATGLVNIGGTLGITMAYAILTSLQCIAPRDGVTKVGQMACKVGQRQCECVVLVKNTG